MKIAIVKSRSFINDVKAHKNKCVIIDEVQKISKLLDLVHVAIKDYKSKFILTGSSARKLKRGGANLWTKSNRDALTSQTVWRQNAKHRHLF